VCVVVVVLISTPCFETEVEKKCSRFDGDFLHHVWF
jgi:hypothetical protein